MRHLVVLLAVIYAVIGDGWAQNRGSSRYVPPEDFEGDITRAPRPTRGSSVRRQRPTKAPESPVVEELKPYEPPESPVRTTARRIPERGTSQEIAVPHGSSLPVDDSASHFASPAQGLHEASPAGPEGRQQGTRRRRPKKRRRPQNAIPKSVEEPNKQIAADEERSSITDLLNEDKKRTGVFQNNPVPRNSPSAYNSESDYSDEKSPWENNHPSEQQNNAAGSPYYRPQTPSNRLPVGNSEPVGNSRGYSAPSLAVPAGDVSRPQSSLPNDASYIPVLSPIRVPSEGASRLPPENYPAVRGKETAGLSSDPNTLHRGHSNRPPVANPDDITGAKPVHNIIPQSDESPLPVSGHSGEPLISSQYVPPRFDSPEHLLTSNPKVSEDSKESPSASNRLPNPSEIHYDSIYPDYSNAQLDGSQRIAGRRQEPEETPVGPPITSYSVPRRNSGTKPQEYDNDAEVDRRQVSQYRPPLQRAGSRHKTEDSDTQSRTRVQEQPPTRVVSRTRGPSRYQQPTIENVPERTRGLTRSNSNAPANSSPRAGSSTVPRSTVRTRGSQRYVPNTVETAPTNPTEEASYVPVDHGNPELLSSSVHSQPSASSLGDLGSIRNTLRSHPQSEVHGEPSASSLGDSGSIRNTLRSHPQSEIHSPPANSGDSGSIRNTLRSRPQSAVHSQPPGNSGDSSSIRNTLRSRSQSEVPSQTPASFRSVSETGPIRNTLRSGPQSEVPSQPQGSFRSVSETGSIRNTLRSRPQSEVPSQPQASFRSVSETGSIRNTLRSRPQYEVPDSEHSDSYEESVEDLNTYNTDYQLPQQTNPRVIPNQRTPLPRQQPPQSAYQSPANRQHSRQDSHYEPPQNPRSRQQPQYEAPHNPRVDSRQAHGRQNPSTSRQQSRSKHSNEPPQHPRSSVGGSNFKCPDSFGFFSDPVQCDKYYECRNGTAEMHLCNDGLAFNEISAPKFLRCDSLRDVDCKSRPELQEPQPTQNCPRKFGLFAHETDCTKFWNCVDGTATEVQCPPGLTYNDERATCDWADLVETSCKSEDLLGFTCPEPTTHDLLDGVYARYPHPDNCQLHFTCIKGADGLRRPRMLSCNEGLVFDPETSACKRPEEVPGCEDFYGGRSQAPKKKPARQPPRKEPEPEPEEIAEEPTPRPRRRGSNRRVRY